MRITKPLPMLLVAGLAVALAGCSTGGATPASTSDASAAPAAPIKMTIGYTASGAVYSDLYICEDQGIYKKNGLDATLSRVSDSSQLAAAIQSGSVQIGGGLASSVAAPMIKGIDLRYIGMETSTFIMEMWGKSSIKSPEDVKGMRVGLSSPGSLGDAAVDAWLAAMGWPETAIKKTFLKNTAAEVTGLRAGAVDAIVTQPPTGTQTREFGFHKIMDFTKYPAAGNIYATSGSYIKENPKAVAAWVKSEVECLAMLHQDKTKAVASIVKHVEPNESLADYSYDFFQPIWSKTLVVDPKLIDDAFTKAAATSNLTKPSDTAKYIDNSFTEKLQKSGYTNSLYK